MTNYPNNLKNISPLIALLIIFAICLIYPNPLIANWSVKDVVIKGNERIEADTIKAYMAIETGRMITPESLNRALKELFATGLFADITISHKDLDLIVNVVENPIINRVAFEGNQRIEDDQLSTEIQLRPRVVYTRTRVQDDTQRILDLYRGSGRFGATVEPKVIKLSQNRVDLVFEIDEGPSTGIRSINFIGNKRFSDSALRDEIVTKESAWYKFFTSTDTYDPDRLTFDRELLRKFYLRNGFADFRVLSSVAELASDKESFFITFSIDEGKRYKFGSVKISSNLSDLKEDALDSLIKTERGQWYDSDKVEKTIQEITNAAGDSGYAFVDVRPEIVRDGESLTIDIVYSINEGPKVYIQRIDVVGNMRTLDRVVRREFKLVEGDAFNAAKIRKSKQSIQNLGYFSKVDVENSQGNRADQSILTVSVEEQSTGELSFGAGVSSNEGLLGDIGIVERNLLGRGQILRLNTTLSTKSQEIDLSFTEPYFLGRNLLGGIDFFRKTSDQQDISSYDEKNLGGKIRIGYSLSDEFRHNVRYTLRRDEIKNIETNASRFIRDQEGTRTTSSIGHTLSYDIRDSKREPTEGYIVRFNQELAGIGGSVKHLKQTIDYSYHYPLGGGWVANAQVRNGHIVGLNQDVRINNRFLLGGGSLRGFEPGGVGPRDLSTQDSLGGNFFYTGTAELSFPLEISKQFPLSGSFFSDVGALTTIDESGSGIGDSGDPRMSIGVGFGYRSPLGPIRLDFASALMKKNYDRTEGFRFSFGTRF
tara:strand:- start:44242 stop:46533 length:2292 start_codon:yes stop_codon:yes gene_type:complete